MAAIIKPSRHWLKNSWGWTIRYEVVGMDRVTICRSYRGMEIGEVTISREEARRHYKSLLNGGFTTYVGDL